MQFTFEPMTEADAHQIASWQAPNYAVFNELNELVGFFSFRQDAQDDQRVEIGLGLRPDVTGSGEYEFMRMIRTA